MSVPREYVARLDLGRRPRLRLPVRPALSRAFPRLFALVLVAAALCALLTSTLYVGKVLQREAAAETAHVNAAVRRSGLAGVFHGQDDDGQARLQAAMRRPGVHEVVLIAITGRDLASDPAADPDLAEDPAVERALRGEARVGAGEWRWATPIAMAPRGEDGSPSLAFVVPVFNDAGTTVIGAVVLRRTPGPALAAASGIVATIWSAYLVATAMLYAALAAFLRRGELRQWWARSWGRHTDAREPWHRMETDLCARARLRGIVVRATLDAALPPVAVDAGLFGVVLHLFAAHALESAADRELVLLHVRARPGGVEFAYSIPGAARPDFAAATRTTMALTRAVHDAGGALTLTNEPERGPRLVVTLPA